VVETLVVYRVRGILALGPGVSYGNASLAQSGKIGAIVDFSGSGAIATIEGLLKSDTVTLPLWQVFGIGMHVLNPRVDYSDAELYFIFNVPGSEGSRLYTWDPRFVARDAVAGAPSPIQGLSVRVLEVDDVSHAETEITGSPFTTDVNGRISGVEVDRDGINLRRSLVTGTSTQTFSHRVVIEGGNYRAVNELITLSSRFEADFPVDVQQTDFEGELNR